MNILRSIARTVAFLSAVTLIGVGLVAPVQASPTSVAAAGEASINTPQVIELAPGESWSADGATPAGEVQQSCGSGWACFYPQTGAGGQRCQYSETTWNAHTYCSWRLDKPKHIINNSRYRVHYYKSTNCINDRIGSTAAGGGGNLAGTYQIKCLQFS